MGIATAPEAELTASSAMATDGAEQVEHVNAETSISNDESIGPVGAKNNDNATAASGDNEAAEADPGEVSASTRADAAPPTANDAAEIPAAAVTLPRSGFFSRMGSLGSVQQIGEAYGRAQKRAVQLREQAGAEVERLRLQREEQAKQESEKAIAIPPATGTLVVGGPINSAEPSEVTPRDVDQDLERRENDDDQQQIDKDSDAATVATSNHSPDKKRQPHHPSVTNKTPNAISSISNAFKIVRDTGADAAKELIFPIDTRGAAKYGDDEEESGVDYISPTSSNEYYSSYSYDDDDGEDNEEKEVVDTNANMEKENNKRSDKDNACNGSDSNGRNSGNVSPVPTTAATTTTSMETLTPNRFTAATSGIFNAVERYRKLNSSSSFDSAQLAFQPPQKESPLLVGGADRVGGLRHFHLDGIIEYNNKTNNGSELPPTLPFRAKTKTSAESSKDGAVKLEDSYPFLRSISKASSTNNDVASTAASETTASEDGQLLPPPSIINGAVYSPKPPTAKNNGRRTSYYEDAVRSVLQPGQRALFFGKGTMGVVLKPTYLASWRGKDGCGLLSATTVAKRGGVFIDSVVPGGHAEKSGVVFIGDHIIKIGSVDVQNMMLEDVVRVILETKRPNIMVLSSKHEVEFVDNNLDENEVAAKRGFVSPLDLVFGFANKLAAEGGKDFGVHEKAAQDVGPRMTSAISRNSLFDEDDDVEEDPAENDGEEEVLFKSPGKDFSPAKFDDHGRDKLGADPQSNSTKPTSYDIDCLLDYASHETNARGSKDAEEHHQRSSLMKHVALFNSDFRTALRLSLSQCCQDPRRYTFLEHFFKNNYLSKKEMEAKKERSGYESKVMDDNDVTSSINQRRLLELYMELCEFHDAITVCSISDREKLLGNARKISRLFLSEDGAPSNHSDTSCLPEYVAHVALGGMENVHAVRFALKDEDEFFECDNNGDGFHCIRSSLEAFLSSQESFLLFLISDDCARMRAYLRGCSPFLCVEPQEFLQPDAIGGTHHNFLLHAILHLTCMKENTDDSKCNDENFIKNDALLLNSGKRNMGAASLLSCSIFVMRSLQKSMNAAIEGLIEDGMTGTGDNLQIYSELIENFQFFWEVYIAPAGGSLSSLALSQGAQDSLNDVRRLIVLSVDEVLTQDKSSDDAIPMVAMARALSSAEMLTSVHSLAEALLREYTMTVYPNFRRHIFHEWACKEAIEHCYDAHEKDDSAPIDEYLIPNLYKGLSRGWMNRFLRQTEFPDGMSLHRPGPTMMLPEENGTISSTTLDLPAHLHNGDVALVFGSDAGATMGDQIQRFSCVSIQPPTDGPRKEVLFPDDVPPIFESYAAVPPFHERPFQGILKDEKNSRISIDGWEVSLTNFAIPSQAMGGSMYCVSLVFRKSSNAIPQMSEQQINDECVSELQHDNCVSGAGTFVSPLFFTESEAGRSRKMKVSQELNIFNSKLHESKWSQRFGQGATIGLSLISSRNVIQAMRETLSLLFKDFCSFQSTSENVKAPGHLCQPLIDILGVLSHSQVEKTSLGCLLQPYLSNTTSKWVHRPVSDQSDIFLEAAGKQLVQALPPVPLALAFATLLLEQKVVFSSSRRGMLMSASFAMMQLLKPLKWAHLQVPLVPASMMNELIHYPAPFVLGIPTDEKESAAILSTLPSDVTLVDLDVGRVILASAFANASKSEEGEGSEAVAGALRSQVLFLAECLGGAFGAAMYRNSWCSDSPLQVIPNERHIDAKQSDGNFPDVLAICDEFISELVSGIHACCLWIEEKHDQESNMRSEPAILFDEDRFFQIKNLRAEGRYLPLIKKSDLARSDKFSLSLDNFDLIFETFLRTQCLSTYISGGNKKSMSFW